MSNENQKEFIIIVNAKDLVKHTFRMTSSKRFPRKYRFTVVNRLCDLTVAIFEHVQEANELDLSDPIEFRERQYHQKKALTKCKTVMFLIELSHECGLISKEQTATWTKCLLDVKRPLAKWKRQDRERVIGSQNRRNQPRQ